MIIIGISYQWVRTADKKREWCNNTGVIETDQRGKHSNRPFAIPEKMKARVGIHIGSFPVMESHFCREHSSKDCLEEGSSISEMYRLYK